MSGFRALTESLILLIVIAGGNAVFGGSDPGWFSLNPTPYLLVPMLVGMRYGFVSGLISGLLTAVLTAGAAVLVGGRPLQELFEASPFALLAMPAVGVIAGEARRALAARTGDLSNRALLLESEISRARADLELSQETQAQLQEQLVLHGAKFSPVDQQLQKRFEPGGGPVLPGTLESLGALCDMESSAFYRKGKNGKLSLDCAYGDTSRFPDQLEGPDAEMASAALEAGELATPHGALEAGRPTGDLIAALPWPGGEGVVIAVAEMPPESLSWQNLARAETFCRWVAAISEQEAGGDRVLDSEALHERFELASKTASEQGVPSTVVLFTVAAGLARPVDQEALQTAVLPKLGAADVAGLVEREDPHLAVLLPMRDARTARRLVESAGEEFAGEAFIIRNEEAAEEVWKALTDVE